MKHTLKESLSIALAGMILRPYFKAWEKDEKLRQARAQQRLTEVEQAAILAGIPAMDATVHRTTVMSGVSTMPAQIIYSLNTKETQIEAKYLYGDFVAHITSDKKIHELPNNYSSVAAHDAAFAWQLYGALETKYRKQQNAR